MIAQDSWQAHEDYLVDNLTKGIYKSKCKTEHNNIKCEICGIKSKNCECYFESTNVKDELMLYKLFMLQYKLSKKVWWNYKEEIC